MSRIVTVIILCSVSATGIGQMARPTSADLLKQAAAAYQAKQYEKSAVLYRRALPLMLDFQRAGVEYNLACSLALAGERRESFDTLERAVEDGYTDRKDTERDKDLLSLHTDPRWQAVLDEMSDLKNKQNKRWGDAAFAIPNAPNIPDDAKLAGLSELWAQAKYGFANFWHVPELNWDQTYREFIPQVLATRSTEDYYHVLQRFYALLRDGHSNVYSPDQLNGLLDRLDLRTRLVDGHLLLIGSRNPTANLQGLHPGDEIVAINGEPAVAWAERNIEPFVSASSQQDRDTRTFEYVPFVAPIGTTFKLGIETPQGKRETHFFKVGKSSASQKPLFEIRALPGGLLYVALNGFDNNTAAKEWDKHWPEIQQAKALVLDLRENGGGDDSVGFHILASLITKNVPGELSRSTRWIATYRAWGAAETPLRFPVDVIRPDRARHFARPVALLTSPRTFSAGEDMVVVFAQAHRGVLVGEPTAGSSGQPLMFKLPGGGAARICTKHDSFADGHEFVGVGVQPDIPVHLTRNDIIEGRDRVLETAIQTLQTAPSSE